MADKTYDLIVIGGGAAGSTAANTAAAMQKHVALIEADKLGGTCLNYGCDPTKTLLQIATMLHRSRYAQRYGLSIPAATFDWQQVQDYVQSVITRIRGGSLAEADASLKKQGIDVFHTRAAFTSSHTISVEDQTLYAEKIIVATGTSNQCPPVRGLQEIGYITNKDAVYLPQLPGSLAIIGAGPIGLEFAQLFQRFGVQVTVLEHNTQLLNKEEQEQADQLCDILSSEGIKLATGIELNQVERAASGQKQLIYQEDGAQKQLAVDEILLATGRRPNLDGLNTEAATIHTTEKGISVDATLRTSVSHIWAAGDITGGYQYTHVASDQGRLAANNAFAPTPQPFTDQAIPWVTYTDPPLAHIGKTEAELRDEGCSYKVARLSFEENERAIMNGRTSGCLKLLTDENGIILGGHILGERADDLLAQIVLAMKTGISVQTLAHTILPYPTLSEAVRWTADRL
ncbi:dihydrolipoyl dehydrogenase family protein [Dictyobacter formicarum]|uniref:Mercuric reductase n=1 Tax=Dictyobacter formicarum TaxID=2778368 RepID=A0ABQ3VPG8_9CHLR|nr:NAD(P)/FAD-dependent oxidoreductase [Dictyobacter formicarum]GHO87742.1 mercuric reductase [Dictyobacter formicarum]